MSKSTFLDIDSTCGGIVASAEVTPHRYTTDVVVDDIIEEDTSADFYVAEPLSA